MWDTTTLLELLGEELLKEEKIKNLNGEAAYTVTAWGSFFLSPVLLVAAAAAAVVTMEDGSGKSNNSKSSVRWAVSLSVFQAQNLPRSVRKAINSSIFH